MIGHTSALRHKTGQGWTYSDPLNQSFAEGMQFFGYSLPSIDAYVEQLEAQGDPDAPKLRQHRIDAFRERRNFDLSVRYLEAILMHQRDAEAFKSIRHEQREKREAWTAAKVEKEAADKARKGTAKKLSAKQTQEIRAKLANGSSVSALSREYGVSRPTIDKCKAQKELTANDPFSISKKG